ncbi:hypothetical protein I3843_04G116800 [Carya illinoinensis]|nr:hypothetical protein I3843_04G116800 [Carya illinoinensis]
MEIVHFFFGIFGNITALVLFLAPIITFKRIIRNKGVKFSGVPYVITCSTASYLHVSTINGTGAAIELIYDKIFGIFSFVVLVFSIEVLVSLLALEAGKTRKVFCGFAASIFSIIIVEFMPFFLSLFVFLCGTSWFVFGLLGRDPFVAVPNGFGCGLGIAQLILYFMYRDNRGTASVERSDIESVETGLPKENKDQSQSNVSGAQVDRLEHVVV